MKIVVLTSLPRLPLLPRNFLPYYLQRQGIPIAAVIARRVSLREMARAHVSSGGLLRRIPELFKRAATSSAADMAAEATPRTKPDRIPIHYVDDHNSPEAVALLKDLAPDLVVLGGTGIIKPAVLNVPRIGTLGCHYALLPELKGFNVTEWAILEGRPVGVTIFWVDAGVDTGDILMDRRVPILPLDTIATLRRRSAEIGKQLFAESIRLVLAGTAPRHPQPAGAGRQFFRMHPRLLRIVERKLATLAAR